MNEKQPASTGDEWLRAYTVLSRSGLVNEAIRRCEEAWGNQYLGNPSAAEQVRETTGYTTYATALRGLLTFPLTVYRVMPVQTYET